MNHSAALGNQAPVSDRSLDSADVPRIIAAMEDDVTPLPAQDAGQEEQAPRQPYVPPTLELRGSLASTTLVSGEECVFAPPPC